MENISNTKIIVSVIICTYNRENLLTKAVNSLLNQNVNKDIFEIIVVDNNSTDNTSALCKGIKINNPNVHFNYLLEKNQGSSYARNLGASIAVGEVFVFIDDDAEVVQNYIEVILDFRKKHPNIESFGGKIIPKYDPKEPKWMSHYVSSLVGNFDYSEVIVSFSKNRYPLESNMVVLKSVFFEVGGFNKALPGVKGSLRIGGEGKDFFFKVKKRGYNVYYVPQLIVYHNIEVKKLTAEYMYRVASGIGRGERIRVQHKGKIATISKFIEYIFKFQAAVIIAIRYLCIGKTSAMWPLIKFRIDVLKGFLDKSF